MHTIKANGGRLTIMHQRSFEEILDRPHITRWKCAPKYPGQDTGMWAVYYLIGKQSRIRCNLHNTLAEAIAHARQIDRMNMGRPRFKSP